MIELFNVNSPEDEAQFIVYLTLKGLSITDAHLTVAATNRSIASKEKRYGSKLEKYKEDLLRPSKVSPLVMILAPEEQVLKSMPAYDRYVAYLLSEHSREVTASMLGMSRRTLYNWLASKGYQPIVDGSYATYAGILSFFLGSKRNT